MTHLPDAIVKLRDELAEKYADENSSKGREDFNRPIRTRAFKAGWDAKASQNDECLRVALLTLKDCGYFVQDVLARANQAISTDCPNCDYQCQGCIRNVDDAESTKMNIEKAIATIERIRSGK